jgi:hypothetical protein
MAAQSAKIEAGHVHLPPRERDFYRKWRRKPARCHRASVSGWTIVTTFVGNHRYIQTKKQRSLLVSRARPFNLRFYLPKYSPDLNPIEQFFAKLKHWLRKAAQRTIEAVYDAIGPILDTVTPAESANYFTNAGYDQA